MGAFDRNSQCRKINVTGYYRQPWNKCGPRSTVHPSTLRSGGGGRMDTLLITRPAATHFTMRRWMTS